MGKTSIITRFMYDKFDNTYQVWGAVGADSDRARQDGMVLWRAAKQEGAAGADIRQAACLRKIFGLGPAQSAAPKRSCGPRRRRSASTSCPRLCTWKTGPCGCSCGGLRCCAAVASRRASSAARRAVHVVQLGVQAALAQDPESGPLGDAAPLWKCSGARRPWGLISTLGVQLSAPAPCAAAARRRASRRCCHLLHRAGTQRGRSGSAA